MTTIPETHKQTIDFHINRLQAEYLAVIEGLQKTIEELSSAIETPTPSLPPIEQSALSRFVDCREKQFDFWHSKPAHATHPSKLADHFPTRIINGNILVEALRSSDETTYPHQLSKEAEQEIIQKMNLRDDSSDDTASCYSEWEAWGNNEPEPEISKHDILSSFTPVSFLSLTSLHDKPFMPYEQQVELMDAVYLREGKSVLVKESERHVGITTTLAGLAVFHAVTKPDQSIVVFAPTKQAARELHDIAHKIYSTLPPALSVDLSVGHRGEFGAGGAALFANGSKIEFKKAWEAAMTGCSCDLMLMDRFDDFTIGMTFLHEMLPSINEGGQMVVCSGEKTSLEFDTVWNKCGDAYEKLELSSKE